MSSRKRAEPDLPEGDDGHTIVNMNVEGMPWYAPRRPDAPPEGGAGQERMTRRESWLFTWGALKAALLVTGVMCLGIVLFVLLCLALWR